MLRLLDGNGVAQVIGKTHRAILGDLKIDRLGDLIVSRSRSRGFAGV